jgi:hypothetical protein
MLSLTRTEFGFPELCVSFVTVTFTSAEYFLQQTGSVLYRLLDCVVMSKYIAVVCAFL